jgi:mRNA interferase YafQ
VLRPKFNNRAKKDLQLSVRRGLDISKLIEAVVLLAADEGMASAYQDHALTGDFFGSRDCHISPDWLLIYRIDRATSELHLLRIGTHSDLF